MKKPARVAIVGRPNVGKSTLFNRITGKRRALVHSTPGVTRDAQRHLAEWAGVTFELVDTGGLFSGIDDTLIREVEERAMGEAMHADAMILVTDGRAGLTAADSEIVEHVRAFSGPVFVAVNKCEGRSNEHAAAEFFELGFENVFAVSALHGEGVGDLLDKVVAVLPEAKGADVVDDMKLALIGRPNVGKSSLLNALSGSAAQIVDSRPGTTRDSIDLSLRWHGRHITVVDTAGIKKRSRGQDGLTSLTALKSIDSIERADIVALVIDASREIASQDVRVAGYAHKAGKGLFFCVNKWDLVEEKTGRTASEFEKTLRREFRFVPYAPVIFTSALTGQRVHRILETAWAIKEAREQRVDTAAVNRLVRDLVAKTPPSFHAGGTGKIYYASQVDVAPPTFVLFVNRRAFFARSYLRFLNNRIRERYGFPGTVIRIKLNEKTEEASHS